MFWMRFITNDFDTSTTNLCIEKDVLLHQVFCFFCCCFCRNLCFVVITTTNQKFEIILLIYRSDKWSKATRCEERVIEPSEKSDDECDSNLRKADAMELKDDITLIQKHEDIVKNTKDFEQLFEVVVLIESTLYFKINLYKFISKYPVLERLTL